MTGAELNATGPPRRRPTLSYAASTPSVATSPTTATMSKTPTRILATFPPARHFLTTLSTHSRVAIFFSLGKTFVFLFVIYSLNQSYMPIHLCICQHRSLK
ncbi:hypothetical protein FS749_015509 [Ceratobasidium sp. UAMH 11750]|nr:hypothetical protein FS749_015509 [Ceratobasidium sp. UAMH 11750]